MRRLWWRWSLRDLRRRWLLVTTIALVVGLGTGTYAALLGTSEWRRRSNDASFSQLNIHDLRVRLSAGSTVPEGTLRSMVHQIPHAGAVAVVRERLVVPTQFAVPGGVLASGELVGTEVGSPTVDGVSRHRGAALAAADDGQAVVVLERAFASGNHLPDAGTVVLSGGVSARYVGTGQSPEYFVASGGAGGLPFMSQASWGAAFTGLRSAQRLTGATGRVNDVVLTLADPSALDAVRRELRSAVAARRPAVGGEVTGRQDVDAYRILYDDIEGDEQLWRAIALLVLLGAAVAALNLTTRVIEAQRREIGVGMALGVRDGALALRPLLFGAQVALIGVALGVAVGSAVGVPLRAVFTDMVPLPVWLTPFQRGVFAQAAAIGFVLPFAAVVWPVVRAVRVQPVDAIRVGHLAARRGGRAGEQGDGRRRAGRLRLPGRSWHQIPLRNLSRTPRRSALTVLGIAAAITTLVTTMGFLDTFTATLDASAVQSMRTAPDRISVSLRTFEATDGETVRAIRALPQVSAASAGILLPVSAARDGGDDARRLDLVVQVLREDAPWRPDVVSGSARGGLVIARKAADDLGVGVGDVLTVTHPQLTSAGVVTTSTRVHVAGVHPDPVRVMAYLDETGGAMFADSEVTNVVTVVPRASAARDDVRRALLALPSVSAAQTARATVDDMRSSLDDFVGILRVAAAVTLLLALLIAFNTASIGMDERSREHATMLAFGLPVRTVLAMSTVESALLGLLGTLVGIAGGFGMLAWITSSTLPQVMPELGATAALSPQTLVGAVLLGMATVALAPLLTLRRLRRTDIPTTLRVVE